MWRGLQALCRLGGTVVIATKDQHLLLMCKCVWPQASAQLYLSCYTLIKNCDVAKVAEIGSACLGSGLFFSLVAGCSVGMFMKAVFSSASWGSGTGAVACAGHHEFEVPQCEFS